MSVLSPFDGPTFLQSLHFLAGVKLAEDQASPTPAYNMAGMLYLSNSGFVLLSVPNALVRGVFSAISEPGVELPPTHNGVLNAHSTVLRPEEIARIGGADKITERGKQFRYSLGRLKEVVPDGWPEMAKVYYLTVHSPELQALRRSYGLSGLPNEGKHEFHITVAIKRKGILGRNEKTKANG